MLIFVYAKYRSDYMQKVFIGILLILLDFHLEFSTGHLGLIPDFIGYFVLLLGLRQLAEDGPSFKRAIPAAIGIGIYSFFLWVADLFGFAATQSPMVIFCEILSVFLALYVTRLVVEGVGELASATGEDLHYKKLKIDWYVMAVFQTLSFSWLFFPALATVCVIISAVDTLLFLFALHKSRRAALAL